MSTSTQALVDNRAAVQQLLTVPERLGHSQLTRIFDCDLYLPRGYETVCRN